MPTALTSVTVLALLAGAAADRGESPALLPPPPPGLALLSSELTGKSKAERLAFVLALLLLGGPLDSECELLGGDAESARDGGVCE